MSMKTATGILQLDVYVALTWLQVHGQISLIMQNDKDVSYSVGFKKSKIFSNRFIQADD